VTATQNTDRRFTASPHLREPLALQDNGINNPPSRASGWPPPSPNTSSPQATAGITAHIAGSVGMLGGDNNGTINVGVVSKSDDPRPDIRVRKLRVLPIAERALNLVAGMLTIGPVAGTYLGVKAGWFNAGGTIGTALAVSVIVSGLLGYATWCLTSIVRRRVLKLFRSPLMPAIAGTPQGRPAVVRLDGDCPRCIGKPGRLRFYSRPDEWVTEELDDGRTTKRPTHWTPVAECKRNNGHRWEVELTDTERFG
jgi:hypothetical protein